MTSAFDNPDDMMTGANQVGEGWHQIIRDLEAQLNELDPNYTLQQVKEKFGGLRYYAQITDPAGFTRFHTLIDAAEAKSFQTCEVCGEPGLAIAGGWIKTLCPTHAEERKARRSIRPV